MTRHYSASSKPEKHFVLTTTKTLDDGKPLSGKFYRMLWKDGETTEPISYREGMRIARLRGCQLLPWKESKAYAELMGDTPAAPTTLDELAETSTSMLDSLKELAGVAKTKRKRTTKKRK